MTDAFKVGIEFGSVLTAISKQIYETPLAFIRENVQNAVDAVRIQAGRAGLPSGAAEFSVAVTATPATVTIRDNGIGMTLDDLKNLFWTIGASGKRTPEARAAGCVGMFGIGGFANFGVCSGLSVVSQVEGEETGYDTTLSRADIESAGGAIPQVQVGASEASAPRGTVVVGTMNDAMNVAEIGSYLRDFVKYAEEHVYFNGELISRQAFGMPDNDGGSIATVSAAEDEWMQGDVRVRGRLMESAGHVLHAELTALEVAGEAARLHGWLRFENGALDVLKRGFKLCATTVPTQIGVSGALDCDLLAPTAGRDSLDSESASLIASIVSCMEHAAVLAVLASSERIAQHTRIFRYVRLHGLVPRLGNTIVELADGSETTLSEIARRANAGATRTFFATSRNARLAHLLQTRGHTVVQLPSDSNKQRAVRDYLISYCSAEAFEGRIEFVEGYEDLTRFEKLFLSELQETILGAFEVSSTKLVPGRLSEDVPVYAPEASDDDLTIYVDVRHGEITKLEGLGISSLFRSMVAAFCREYLGPTLKIHSPRFFGSGAVNLDFLSKRRSELWVLLTDDIHVLTHGTQRQIVRSSDVRVVQAGRANGQAQEQPGHINPEPKLIRIEGTEDFADLFGYYLRIPTPATTAYGDVIQQCEDRAGVWVGNKILLAASDGIGTAFQFEVRLDELIVAVGSAGGGSGSAEIQRPVQALFGGLYFPIPGPLEAYLVPTAGREIRIEVRCDWIDFSTSRSWEPATA